MIRNVDQETKKRTDKAIANVRLIASRVKRAAIEDAAQRREIVVNTLNEFRQYVNHNADPKYFVGPVGSFRYDEETLQRLTAALFQADDIYNKLTRVNQKKYEQEYNQVWKLLEDIHAYLLRIVQEKQNHGAF
jgi:hypothetical protein